MVFRGPPRLSVTCRSLFLAAQFNPGLILPQNRAGYSDLVPLITKYLWRKGYLRVPDTCTVEGSGGGDDSTCRTACPSEFYEAQGMSPYDVLMDVNAVYWFAASTQGTVVRLKLRLAGERLAGLYSSGSGSTCSRGAVSQEFETRRHRIQIDRYAAPDRTRVHLPNRGIDRECRAAIAARRLPCGG